MISYLLDYISDYESQLNQIGIDIRPLRHSKKHLVGNNRNLIFSLYILTKWLVNKTYINKFFLPL